MLNLPIKILETQELDALTASITFSSIDTLVAAWNEKANVTSRHLVLIVNAASPDAVAKRSVEIRLNGDAGANYNHETLTGENAVKDGDRRQGLSYLFEYPGGTDYPFAIPGTTYADSFGGGTILFPHAFNTTGHKSAVAFGGAVEDYVNLVGGRWASVNPITSMVISLDTGNFAIGSTIHLGVIDERYLVEENLLAADGQPTFDNIPQGEGDLAIISYLRSDNASWRDWLYLNINDDAVNANYWNQVLVASDGIPLAGSGNTREFATCLGDTAVANAFGAHVAIFSQYVKDNQPHVLVMAGSHDSTRPYARVDVYSLRRANVEPITKINYSLLIGTDFKAGSLFSLYRVPKRIIERIELTEDTPTITFTDIPQNFESLMLHVYARTDSAFTTDWVQIQFNGDAVAANYDHQRLAGIGAVVVAVRALGDMSVFLVPAATEGAGEFAGGSILLPAYAKTDRHKHGLALGGTNENWALVLSKRWENTNAITQIVLTPSLGTNFVAGSVFELEGIKSVISPLDIKIGGDDVDIVKGSLIVEQRIEERSIAEFTVVDIDAALEFQKGQPVEIYDPDDLHLFGGVVDTPDTIRTAPSGELLHPIICADWHYLADKRLVAESYLATDAGDIVKDIRTKYLADEGVTVGNIEAGPEIIEAVFNYVQVSDAYDALAEKAGKIWYIDEEKKLFFIDRGTITAPWTATGNDMGKKSSRLSGANPLYRNRQYIRGGRGTTALQKEKFVADGEQNAFTLSFPCAKVPTFIEVNTVDKLPFGIKGLDALGDFASYWNKGDSTITLTDVPTAGWIVEIWYYGQFDILTLVEDTDEIAAQLAIEGVGTGYVDDIADEPTLNDKDASFDSGKAKLARFGVAGKRFLFSTKRSGLKPGQLLTVNYPALSLIADMLIEAVITRVFAGSITYDITAIQGPELGSWANLFKALASQKQEVIDRLNVGSEQVLIILAQYKGKWGWSETVTKYANVCEFPSASTYPALTGVYPC